MDIIQFKTSFDPKLKDYIRDKINQSKNLLGGTEIGKYFDYIDTFIFSGGKRIRPYCLWLIYKWFAWKADEDILRFSIVFELLHTMALIHDDIIDEAQKRHNVDTMHTHISNILWEEHKQVAESQAILIGDLMLARVYELVNSPYQFTDSLLQQARQNVHAMIEEVILGQMIDVQMMAGLSTNKEMIEKKNMYKTASYTFTRPMLTWAILAGASDKEKEDIIALGNLLWIAFQVRDDLMDITLWDKTKSLFSDIQEWQQTYFTQYIKEHGTEEDKKLLSECMGNTLDDDQILSLQNMFARTKAIENGIAHIHHYTKNARVLLDKITFKDRLAYEWLLSLIIKIEQI